MNQINIKNTLFQWFLAFIAKGRVTLCISLSLTHNSPKAQAMLQTTATMIGKSWQQVNGGFLLPAERTFSPSSFPSTFPLRSEFDQTRYSKLGWAQIQDPMIWLTLAWFESGRHLGPGMRVVPHFTWVPRRAPMNFTVQQYKRRGYSHNSNLYLLNYTADLPRHKGPPTL